MSQLDKKLKYLLKGIFKGYKTKRRTFWVLIKFMAYGNSSCDRLATWFTYLEATSEGYLLILTEIVSHQKEIKIIFVCVCGLVFRRNFYSFSLIRKHIK